MKITDEMLEKLSEIMNVPFDALKKMRASGVLNDSSVRGLCIRHDFKKLKAPGKYTSVFTTIMATNV